MNQRAIVLWLSVLIFAGLLTGCSVSKALRDVIGKQENAELVSVVEETEERNDGIVKVPVDGRAITKLVLTGSQLPNQNNLRIIKFHNGTFYGLGHGPAEDGYRLESSFRFDFNGNFTEGINSSRCFYSDVHEFPVGSSIFYYLQADKDSSAARFKRINYNTFHDEILLDPGNITLDDIAAFYPNGQSVYYLDRRDNFIWKQSFSDGRKKKICECPVDSAEVKEIYVYNNAVYISQYDSCIKADTVRNTREEVISGRILDRYDHYIYFLSSSNVVCVYDTYTGETTETGVFSLYEKPGCMGRWAAILSSPARTIYIWDTEQKKVVREIKQDTIRHLAGAYENRYFLYVISATRLGVIDTKENTDYVIDTGSFAATAENPIDRWFIDRNYLYGQDIFDPNLEEERGDVFYRISLSSLVSASAQSNTAL